MAAGRLTRPPPGVATSEGQTTVTRSDFSTGGSFSVPPTQGSSAVAEGNVIADNISLQQHWGADQPAAPPLPSDIELVESDAVTAGPEPTGTPLLPRRYEFLWQDGQLLFAGDPFDTTVPKQSTSPSTISKASFDTRSYLSRMKRPLPSLKAEDLQTRAFDASVLSEAREYALDRLVEVMYNYYWRTYAPQKSKPSRKRCRDQDSQTPDQSGSAPSSRRAPGESRSTRRRKITTGSDGSDGSGGEEGSGGRGRPLSGSPSTDSGVRFACPYAKGHPILFGQRCQPTLRSIWRLKEHLKNCHSGLRCRNCDSVFDEKNLLKQHEEAGLGLCAKNPGRPASTCPGIMTPEQYTIIRDYRAGRSTSPEDRWYFIFRVLFPHAPTPPSPYPDEHWRERMMEVEKLLEQFKADGCKLLYKEAQKEGCDHLVTQVAKEGSLPELDDRLSSRLWRDVDSNLANEPSLSAIHQAELVSHGLETDAWTMGLDITSTTADIPLGAPSSSTVSFLPGSSFPSCPTSDYRFTYAAQPRDRDTGFIGSIGLDENWNAPGPGGWQPPFGTGESLWDLTSCPEVPFAMAHCSIGPEPALNTLIWQDSGPVEHGTSAFAEFEETRIAYLGSSDSSVSTLHNAMQAVESGPQGLEEKILQEQNERAPREDV